MGYYNTGGFALIVVLFILLVIIGACAVGGNNYPSGKGGYDFDEE